MKRLYVRICSLIIKKSPVLAASQENCMSTIISPGVLVLSTFASKSKIYVFIFSILYTLYTFMLSSSTWNVFSVC